MSSQRILRVIAILPLILAAVQCRGERGGAGGADDGTRAGTSRTLPGGISEFATGRGTLVGLGFDDPLRVVWVYDGQMLYSFTREGTVLDTVAAPGERADDVDLDIPSESLTLARVALPAGTLLFINGESGPAEVYALDAMGNVLATLNTEFGASHVVGGAWHPGRNTLFLVQDNQPAAELANRVAEIDPATGRVLNSFSLGEYSVNYGDIDVAPNGNLVVGSSSSAELAEFTPDGRLVRTIALPEGVSSISGLGINDETGNVWASSTGGTVWRLPPHPSLMTRSSP